MLVLLVLSACSKETEEDKVKKVVTSVQKAAEEKQISAVLDHISKNYLDPQGNDYNGIKGLLAFYFFRHQKVSVYMPNIDIVVTGATAKALFQAVLTGRGPEGGVLPEALGAYNFEVLLKKEDGDWKAASAKWERVGEGAAPPQ
jgi:ketosteroid isomerase-like protein